MANDPAASDAPALTLARWPKVVGTIGVVLGGVMFVDKADDLLLVPLMWAGDSRRWLFGPEIGELVARTMPRALWLAFYILLGMALGLLLLVGSLRLRRRIPSGVNLCRAWAWLSIVWLAAGLAVALWWLGRYGDEMARLTGPDWQMTVLSQILLVLILLLVYPVFLLVWLSRAPVKEEYLTWRE